MLRRPARFVPAGCTPPSSMNIGFYCGALFPASRRGGIQSYVLRLAKALSARGGHDVHLLTDHPPDDSWSPSPRLALHAVHARYLPVLGRWLPGLGESLDIAAAMRALARKHALDIVEFPNWEAPGLAYCWFGPTPTVTRLSTSYAETLKTDALAVGVAERFVCWAERSAARRSTAIVTHTLAHRAYMANELGIPETVISVIPLGLEVPEQPLPPRRYDDRSPLRLLYVGRLEHRKGTVDLLRALPSVVAKAPHFELTLIGRDRPHAPGGRTFREYAERELSAPVRDRLRFRSVVSDEELDDAYRRCDLFVSPSIYESFGLTYVEAMRYGKPAIGCWAGGTPEVIRDGETGLLVPPGQPQALADAILTLLSDTDRRLAMGWAAHAWTRENFSIEVMADRMVDYYRKILSGSA